MLSPQIREQLEKWGMTEEEVAKLTDDEAIDMLENFLRRRVEPYQEAVSTIRGAPSAAKERVLTGWERQFQPRAPRRPSYPSAY